MDININYENITKENIYLKILEPINDKTGINNPFGYYTNITTIPNLMTSSFGSLYYLKKTEINPLILYIKFGYEYINFTLHYFSNTIFLDDIHYRYNFIIQPYSGKDTISISGDGTDIKFIYPKELDFTKKDIFTLRFIMTNSLYSQNIKLNLNSSELICKNLNEMKICNISLKHFIGVESGNYSIYSYNNEHGYLPYQDSPLINVILPNNRVDIYVNYVDNQEGIYLGSNGLLYFVTNYSGGDGIFNTNEFEKKTEVDTKIIGQDQVYHDVTCRLWKPENENKYNIIS